MADLIIRCQNTGMNVQTGGIKQEIKKGQLRFEMITCLACTKFHFINRENGILGQRKWVTAAGGPRVLI
jgi:hypothetical protein